MQVTPIHLEELHVPGGMRTKGWDPRGVWGPLALGGEFDLLEFCTIQKETEKVQCRKPNTRTSIHFILV